MKLIKVMQFNVTLIFLITILTSCTVQLAPKYDAALFNGLTNANVKIMELFASVSSGTNNSTFSQRDKNYNAVIGLIDALALQSKARPIPENSITEKVNTYLESKGIAPMTDKGAPSANSLEEVSKNLSKMKEVDSKMGLKSNVVKVFKNAVIISMDQALTYESFLDR
jgi:hypothetical protein